MDVDAPWNKWENMPVTVTLAGILPMQIDKSELPIDSTISD